jgi:lysophospholipase L1-like esterase
LAQKSLLFEAVKFLRPNPANCRLPPRTASTRIMSQAYQAPAATTIDGAEPILHIQQPNPKLLARRAVDQAGHRATPKVQGIQPQRLKVPPQQAKRQATGSRVKPAASRSTSPKRIQIDWEARLREARLRLAQSNKANKPQTPTKARIGAALELPRSIRQPATSQPVIRAPKIDPTAGERSVNQRPHSGSQLYAQRLNALRNGQLYTQIPVDSFYDQWRQASGHPTYAQWRELLALEARTAERSNGRNNVTAMVGDSLSQWFPADQLPGRQLWLNQGISGDTTTGILDRIAFLDRTKLDTIYFMAGVNDLKRGASDREILQNIRQIIARLKRQHPQAQIVVQSILPTRSEQIPNDRIDQINPLIQELARRQGVDYLDLHQQFRDGDGSLRADLTTDGIHLSPQGYQVWQSALQRMDQRLAQRPRTIAQAEAKRGSVSN